MPGKGSIVAVTVILVCGVAVAAVVSGRAPKLKEASQSVAATVASIAASYASSSLLPEAGAEAGVAPRRQAAPLSSAQLGAPLVHGTFVSACGAPDDMKVTLKVSVRGGRAVSVSVKSDPPNPAVAACIERAARDQQWDISPKTDQVTVTY
jgi:hypothetical protein